MSDDHDRTLSWIFAKPGKDLDEDETNLVYRWLFEDAQRRYTLTVGRRAISGYGATPEDMMDLWQEFCLRLPMVVKSYDPMKAGGPTLGAAEKFRKYLTLCFKRHCRREYKRLNKRKQVEEPLPEQDHNLSRRLRKALTLEAGDPDFELDRQKMIAFTDRLPKNYAEILKARLSGLDNEDIAHELGLSKGLVRVRLHRAIHKMTALLKQEGGSR